MMRNFLFIYHYKLSDFFCFPVCVFKKKDCFICRMSDLKLFKYLCSIYKLLLSLKIIFIN